MPLNEIAITRNNQNIGGLLCGISAGDSQYNYRRLFDGNYNSRRIEQKKSFTRTIVVGFPQGHTGFPEVYRTSVKLGIPIETPEPCI
jgi:hypothetical protein